MGDEAGMQRCVPAFRLSTVCCDYMITENVRLIMSDHPPDKVCIPTPVELSKKRGLYAKKADDLPTSIRLTPHDKALVDAEAAKLGLTFSTFMRWCGVQCARQLHLNRTGILPKADL